ncbi:MAG: DUF6334 family protein [Pyrinomonadaceae bacterium]
MKTLNDFLGESITRIQVKLNADFEAVNNEILIDQLFVHLENVVLQIQPFVDTDEVRCDLLSPDEAPEDYQNCQELAQFLGRTFSEVWVSTNSRGYSDLLILGLKRLNPTLLILSEGGVLKLINADSNFVTSMDLV